MSLQGLETMLVFSSHSPPLHPLQVLSARTRPVSQFPPSLLSMTGMKKW